MATPDDGAGAAGRPVHGPEDATAERVARIAAGVADRTLPKLEWTHAAHLVAATVLLRSVGLAAAEARMPDMIRRYNEATGVANTDEGGYHHTLTLFYLRALAAFLQERGVIGEAVDDAAACRAVLAASIADRAYPLTFYTHDHLFSIGARRGWVAPDRAPLPDAEATHTR